MFPIINRLYDFSSSGSELGYWNDLDRLAIPQKSLKLLNKHGMFVELGNKKLHLLLWGVRYSSGHCLITCKKDGWVIPNDS